MNKKNILVALIIILILIIIGNIIIHDSSSEISALKQYIDTEIGFSFTYPDSESGYVIIDRPTSDQSTLLSHLVVYNKLDYQEFAQASDVREGPPSIELRVYDNSSKYSPTVWAMNNQAESNYALVKPQTEIEAVVGGANAIRYQSDGLWPIDTYVVANDNKIFLLAADITDESSEIANDFQGLINSFAFL